MWRTFCSRLRTASLASLPASACAAAIALCDSLPTSGDPWKTGQRERDEWRRGPDSLHEFGRQAQIPQAAYKDHFKNAYDTAATERDGHASNGTVARRVGGDGPELAPERAMRRTIARHLMAKLGYTEEELDALGDDVLRMQGVNSPFRHAALRAGEAVLDLGSGYGTDAMLAARKVGEHGHVVGLDLSKEEVRKAQERATERGMRQCRFEVGDMEAPPFADGSFDVVISNGGFCLCPDKRRAFREIYRVLRPGGRIAIACTVNRAELPALNDRRWPPCMEVFMLRASVEPLLASLGFEHIEVDSSNDRMDVWEVDVQSVAGEALKTGSSTPVVGCSHAQRAAKRRKQEEVSAFLHRERESGIHWGNPEFNFTKEMDMNELCARVVICAEKPR